MADTTDVNHNAMSSFFLELCWYRLATFLTYRICRYGRYGVQGTGRWPNRSSTSRLLHWSRSRVATNDAISKAMQTISARGSPCLYHWRRRVKQASRCSAFESAHCRRGDGSEL